MFVIFGASTGAGAPRNTSRFVGPILRFLHVPEQYHNQIHFAVRKSAHFIEYAILGILLLRALRASYPAAPRQFLLALMLCALYAATDEFHQLFVKGRESSVHDVLIDTCGATFGLTIFYFCTRRRKT